MEMITAQHDWRQRFVGATAGEAVTAFFMSWLAEDFRDTQDPELTARLQWARLILARGFDFMTNRPTGSTPKFPEEWGDPVFDGLKDALEGNGETTRYIGCAEYPVIDLSSDAGRPPRVVQELLSLVGLPAEAVQAPMDYRLGIERGFIELLTRDDHVDHGTVWEIEA